MVDIKPRLVVRREINTPYVHLVMQDGIVIAVCGNLELTRDIAEVIVRTRVAFTEGEGYPVLVDITQIASVSKEARLYLSRDEAVHGISAGALLVNSAFSTFIGNFFLKIAFSNPFPTQLFHNKATAIKWLQQFRKE